MRLIFLCFLVIISFQCVEKTKQNNKPNVILEFLTKEINQKGLDIRVLNPPLPPELKGKTDYVSGIKPDSLINKLEPLILHINDSIIYDELFKTKMNPIEGFEYLKTDTFPKNKNSIYLNISTVKDKKGIVLKSINDKAFYENHKSERLNDNYGGLMCFRNLFFSKNQQNAYFEIYYYKGPLEAIFLAVYAEYKNSKWHFKSELISFS